MLKPSEQVTSKVEVTSDRAEEGIEDYENDNEEEDEEPINQNFRSSVLFIDSNPANIDILKEAYNSDS